MTLAQFLAALREIETDQQWLEVLTDEELEHLDVALYVAWQAVQIEERKREREWTTH